MDPVTAAIVTALSAGAVSGLTETSKMAITDAYAKLKNLLSERFGVRSSVVQAIEDLETRPASVGRKETLREEIIAVQADQDEDLLAAAQQVMSLIQSQQVGLSKFTIQNNALVQGQNIGDNQQITQYFGNPPKA